MTYEHLHSGVLSIKYIPTINEKEIKKNDQNLINEIIHIQKQNYRRTDLDEGCEYVW